MAANKNTFTKTGDKTNKQTKKLNFLKFAIFAYFLLIPLISSHFPCYAHQNRRREGAAPKPVTRGRVRGGVSAGVSSPPRLIFLFSIKIKKIRKIRKARKQ